MHKINSLAEKLYTKINSGGWKGIIISTSHLLQLREIIENAWIISWMTTFKYRNLLFSCGSWECTLIVIFPFNHR